MAKKFLNFTIAVPSLDLGDYCQSIMDGSNAAGVPLTKVADALVKGNTEVWRLTARVGHGKARRKVAVTGYESGSITFQGLDPNGLGLVDVQVVNKW